MKVTFYLKGSERGVQINLLSLLLLKAVAATL